MSYVNSNNIRIFPSSNRGVNSGHFGNNFATEYNLSSIVNKLLSPYIGGESGFLISHSLDGTLPAGSAEFNIGGYFIEVGSWSDVIAAALANPNNSTDTEVVQSSFVTFTCKETSSGNRIYLEKEGESSKLIQYESSESEYSGTGPYYIEATISVADVSANATDLSENSTVLEDKSYRVMQGEDATQAEENIASTSTLSTDETFTLRLIDCESAGAATITSISNWKLHDESRLSFVNFRVDDGDLDGSPFTGE